MIRNSTIPKVGKVGRRWASWRRQQADIVRKREGGICAGCGRDGRRLEVAHLCGRRNVISEPWASWHGMCAHLCAASVDYGDGCHEKIDGSKDLPLQDRLRRKAAVRLSAWLGFGSLPGPPEMAPVDVIRELVRYAEANRIEP